MKAKSTMQISILLILCFCLVGCAPPNPNVPAENVSALHYSETDITPEDLGAYMPDRLFEQENGQIVLGAYDIAVKSVPRFFVGDGDSQTSWREIDTSGLATQLRSDAIYTAIRGTIGPDGKVWMCTTEKDGSPQLHTSNGNTATTLALSASRNLCASSMTMAWQSGISGFCPRARFSKSASR